MSEFGSWLLTISLPDVYQDKPEILHNFLKTTGIRLSEEDPPGSERRPKSNKRLTIDVLYQNMLAGYQVLYKRHGDITNQAVRLIGPVLAKYPYSASGFLESKNTTPEPT